MRLVTVASLSKIKYLSGMAFGKVGNSTPKVNIRDIFIILAHKRDFIGDFWTSGVKSDPNKMPYWAAREKPFVEETQWKAGEPSGAGDCIYYESRTSHLNSSLAAGDCAVKKKFICEVSFCNFSSKELNDFVCTFS
jgi:hypothetical protein